MTHALVTGASGFIGEHLVKCLYEHGFDITCLVRPSSDRSRLERFRPRYVTGDILDAESIQEAVTEADIVFHLAGSTKSLRLAEMERTNVDGVRNVAQACMNSRNPPTLILVSSLAAAGPTTRGRLLVERDLPNPVSNYGHSKLAGEYAATLYANQFPLTIIRPPIVLGEGDRNGLTMFESIARWNLHLVPGLSDEYFSVIHGKDLAEALILAALNGRRVSKDYSSEGIYFATADEVLTYAELGRIIGSSIGREHVHIVHNPRAVVWCIAAISELSSQIRRHPHIFGLDKAREATAGSWACDGSALRRDVGFAPACSLEDRIAQTAHWYIQEGWLKPVSQPVLVH